MSQREALEEAIRRAGSQTALAARIGKTQGHVSKWLEREMIPASAVLDIENATGLPRSQMRPDLYPDTPGFSETQESLRMGGLTAADLLAIKPRWTVAEIDELEQQGKLEKQRWELIDGEIVMMQSKGIRHELLKVALNRYWNRKLPDDVLVAPETTFRVNDVNMLEPDFVFFPASVGIPGLNAKTALLIVEVSYTSLAYDLGKKALTYARHGIPEVWVINADTMKTTVHREPTAEGYGSVKVLAGDKRLDALLVADASVVLANLKLS